MMDIDGAIAALQQALGDDHVLVDPAALHPYETATFHTDNDVPAVLRPANTAEVQACLRIANQFRVPLYPISTGLNTGYGSTVPAAPGCMVMELKRLNRIIEYNEDLGYVTVEPGVTQQQLYDYLQQRDAPFWLDVTGASPAHSMIGNIAERGFGHTAYSDHYAHVGGMQVVLPEGDLIATGFGQYDNAKATGVYRWGVGPHYDGLFTQSNLGVMVQATIWLMPKPEYAQFFACRIARDEDLPALIELLRPLRLDGTVRSAMHIGNDYKIISAIQGYPWEQAAGETPLPEDVLRAKVKEWDCGPWNVSGALYGSRATVAAARRRLKRQLKGKVSRLQFLDQRLLWLAERVAKPYQWVTGVNLTEMMKMLKPVFGMTQGVPSAGMLPSNYWRKTSMPPASVDLSPEQDNCGVLWLAPVAPTSGAHVAAIWDIVKHTMLSHGYEPAVSITLLTERTVDCVVNVSYDRDIPGEDERAMACHDDMLQQLCAAGYYPYRLGIQTVGKMPPRTAAYQKFFQGLRRELDPNGILAPGRYLP
ncbi:FAD-binding oxidoreductase [Kineobactrum salinum]|nr:FAD-binding oxidoreductase [Kineobactrum salinum]